MWDESINPDTAIANFAGELSKEIVSKGSFEIDYTETCTKYGCVPCPFVQVTNGVCKVSNCIIDISSWRAMLLVAMTATPTLNISSLIVHNCRLNPQHMQDCATALTDKGMKYIKFDYLELSDESKQALNVFLVPEVKVEYLSIRGCGLTDTIITNNITALQSNFYLEGLNLSQNEITDVGATSLFSALRSNIALKEISLGKNKITGEGCMDLLTSLLVGSPSTKEDDDANKAVAKALGDFNKKIKDANKKRKKEKLPDLPEQPGPTKERTIKVDGQMTLANRSLTVVDLMQNPLNFDLIRPALEKMKNSCGPSSITTTFGPCVVSLLLNKPILAAENDGVLVDISVDPALVVDLETVGVSLLL